MGAPASQIISLAIVFSTVNSGTEKKDKKKLRANCLCEGNSPVTGEFSAEMTSNTENASIGWHHYVHRVGHHWFPEWHEWGYCGSHPELHPNTLVHHSSTAQQPWGMMIASFIAWKATWEASRAHLNIKTVFTYSHSTHRYTSCHPVGGSYSPLNTGSSRSPLCSGIYRCLACSRLGANIHRHLKGCTSSIIELNKHRLGDGTCFLLTCRGLDKVAAEFEP